MKHLHYIVLLAFLLSIPALQAQEKELFRNEEAPLHDRITDLLSRLTVEEKIGLLRATSPEIKSEVTQLYVKLPDMNISLPVKQLKGFKRVFIKKGATEKIEIVLPKEQLRYWDEEKAKFVVPSGVFRFMAGASSEDIRLEREIRL